MQMAQQKIAFNPPLGAVNPVRLDIARARVHMQNIPQ
jgi:hypothetical protein